MRRNNPKGFENENNKKAYIFFNKDVYDATLPKDSKWTLIYFTQPIIQRITCEKKKIRPHGFLSSIKVVLKEYGKKVDHTAIECQMYVVLEEHQVIGTKRNYV